MFGEKSVAVMIREFSKIEKGPIPGIPVVTPINPDTLSFDNKRYSLEVVNLVKEKMCGK